jgi:hypothetical protein
VRRFLAAVESRAMLFHNFSQRYRFEGTSQAVASLTTTLQPHGFVVDLPTSEDGTTWTLLAMAAAPRAPLHLKRYAKTAGARFVGTVPTRTSSLAVK